MPTTIVDLLRHGEPRGGRAIRGNSIDDPLSELGWQQMRNAVADYSDWDVIISSPLIRCLHFSEALSQDLAIPLIVEQNLKEVGFGAWEGRTQADIIKTNPDEYSNFYLDPVNNRPEGAESLATFCSRVVTSYNTIIEQYHGQRILFVVHAGVIRALITHTLQAELNSMYRIKVLNAGFTRINYTLENSVENAVLVGHSISLKNA